MIALWFGFINWVNKTKLSCYTPQQTQHHFFSRNVPPFIDDRFSFALVTRVFRQIGAHAKSSNSFYPLYSWLL